MPIQHEAVHKEIRKTQPKAELGPVYERFCQRCDHTWMPRKANIPDVCPKCRSYLWNKPRVIKQEKEDEIT